MKMRYDALALCTVVALSAGCGGSQPPLQASAANSAAGAALQSGAATHVYTANCCGLLNQGAVGVYKARLKVDHRITGGIENPIALTVDRSGTAYVVNAFSSIVEYDSGRRRPSRTIESYGAMRVVLDASSNLYVDRCLSCFSGAHRTPNGDDNDAIAIYAPLQKKPLRTITDGIDMPVALAVDAAGNVFVGNAGARSGHASVTFYGPGSKSVSRKITRGLTWPEQLAVDSSGDLFVANQEKQVIEYAPNSSRRLRTITDGIANPNALAIDAAGTLYVGNAGDPSASGWISVYASGSSSPSYRITDGVDDPVALAVDGNDNLYVANGAYGHRGSVAVYAPNAQHPSQSIESGRYGPPVALALGLR
jgi:hypothetical protein